MIGLGDRTKARASRRAFLKNSTTAMVTWVAAPRRRFVPSVDAPTQSRSSEVTEKGRPLMIEVAAGEYDRQNSPVFFQLPESWRDERDFTLERIDTGELIDTQIEVGVSSRLVWLIRDMLKAGQTRRYRLAPAVSVALPTPAATYDDGRGLMVKVGGRSVMRYNKAVVPAPDPQLSSDQRSGYIYPLFNPIGQAVTDDFPPDHVDDLPPDHAYQHSVWLAWSKATFEGRQVNFWELSERKGAIEHVELEKSGGGAVFAHFTALLHHIDLTAPGGPKVALHETWKVLIYNLTDAFVFDLESTQTCATQSPLQVLENSWGGIAIRGHRNWFDTKNSEYLTSEGKTRKDGNQTRPRWVDMYGWVDGKRSGIALLSHPDNFRFPQPARLHPEKPYFCFAPPALGPFSIEPGKPYRSRYRFYVHQGRPDPAAIDRVWTDFAYPIQGRVVQEG